MFRKTSYIYNYAVTDLYEGAFYLMKGCSVIGKDQVGVRTYRFIFDKVKINDIQDWNNNKVKRNLVEYKNARLKMKEYLKSGVFNSVVFKNDK